MDPKNALDAPGKVGSLDIEWSEWKTVRPRLKEFKTLETLRIRNDEAPSSTSE